MCDQVVEEDKAAFRANARDHLEELESLMRISVQLQVMSLRMAIDADPNATEEQRRARHQRVDALSDGGHYFE